MLTLSTLPFQHCENAFIHNISKNVGSEKEGRSHGLVPGRQKLLITCRGHLKTSFMKLQQVLLIPQVTSVDLPLTGTAAVVKIPCSLTAFHLKYSFHISLIFCLRFFSEVEPAGVCLVYVQSQAESLESQFSSAFSVFLNSN